MNNEINIKIPTQILDYIDTKAHLLDLFNYIINLQKENELLKEELTDLKNDITRVYNSMISLDAINKLELEEIEVI